MNETPGNPPLPAVTPASPPAAIHLPAVLVNARTGRAYVTPIRDASGKLLGCFERFEGNFTQARGDVI